MFLLNEYIRFKGDVVERDFMIYFLWAETSAKACLNEKTGEFRNDRLRGIRPESAMTRVYGGRRVWRNGNLMNWLSSVRFF